MHRDAKVSFALRVCGCANNGRPDDDRSTAEGNVRMSQTSAMNATVGI